RPKDLLLVRPVYTRKGESQGCDNPCMVRQPEGRLTSQKTEFLGCVCAWQSVCVAFSPDHYEQCPRATPELPIPNGSSCDSCSPGFPSGRGNSQRGAGVSGESRADQPVPRGPERRPLPDRG